MEFPRGMRLCRLVTATMGTSREVVAGGHRECPDPDSLQPPPRGGVTSWESWEKGQVGIGSISEVGCDRSSWQCPRGPDPDAKKQERGRASSQAGPVAGFIQHSTNVQRLLEEEENSRESGSSSPELRVPVLLHRMGTQVSPPSAWRLKQIFQVWLPEPLLPVPVFGKFPQHGHHVGVEFCRCWLRF